MADRVAGNPAGGQAAGRDMKRAPAHEHGPNTPATAQVDAGWLFEHIEQPTAFVDDRLRICQWNAAAHRLTGWSAERVAGLDLGSALGIPAATFAAIAGRLHQQGSLQRTALLGRRKGGRQLAVQLTVMPLPQDGAGYLCAFAPAQALSTDEEPRGAPNLDPLIQSVLDAVPTPIAVADGNGRLLHVNPVAEARFQARVGARCCDVYCRHRAGGCATEQAIATRAPVRWNAAPGHCDGQALVARPVTLDDAATPIVLFATEEPAYGPDADELRKFFRAVDQSLVGVLITDADGRIEYANPKLSEICAYSPVELVGTTVFDDSLADAPRALLALPRPTDFSAEWHGEVQCIRKDGRPIVLQVSLSNLRNSRGIVNHWVIVVEDITERSTREAAERALRDQLARASRLAAVGEMASVIAHEINQPLASIANFSAGCIRRLERGELQVEPLVDALKIIARQVTRAGEIVQNVRGLVRREEMTSDALDINTLVEGLLPLVTTLSRTSNCQVHLLLAPALPPVSGQRTQIEQVMLNLIRNGLEAMVSTPPKERRLVIRTARQHTGHVTIEVEDSGCGMGADALHRLGEPFLTTKADGLGLGLSISRTLLEAHGSRLEATPNPRRGMTFRFSLAPAKAD